MSKIDLRDYFAAKAMQAIITALSGYKDFGTPDESAQCVNLEDSVRLAYTYADAMLRYGLDYPFDWDKNQETPT